jgi:hypothetical protein
LVLLQLDSDNEVVMSFDNGGPEWLDRPNRLHSICEKINKERCDTHFEWYIEPTLRDESRYFLLEAQMTMMAAVANGRSPVKQIVSEMYGEEVLFSILKDEKVCYGLRTAALRLFHSLKLDIGGVVPDGHRRRLIFLWNEEQVTNTGTDEYKPSGETIHDWLVGHNGVGDPLALFLFLLREPFCSCAPGCHAVLGALQTPSSNLFKLLNC